MRHPYAVVVTMKHTEKVIWCENDKDPLTFTGLAEARTPERKVRNCHMTTPTPENCPDLPEPLAV